MANLSENPQWVDGIYQIETSDPVVGGPDGVSNRQAKELASRTRYLKEEQEKTGSDLATHVAAADPHTQYAPKVNPSFTGTPKAPTPATDSNSQQVATTAFVRSALAGLVGSAPASLDTLNELAAALNNDPNFSTTVINLLSEKLSAEKNGEDILDKNAFVRNLGLDSAKNNAVVVKNIHDFGARDDCVEAKQAIATNNYNAFLLAIKNRPCRVFFPYTNTGCYKFDGVSADLDLEGVEIVVDPGVYFYTPNDNNRNIIRRPGGKINRFTKIQVDGESRFVHGIGPHAERHPAEKELADSVNSGESHIPQALNFINDSATTFKLNGVWPKVALLPTTDEFSIAENSTIFPSPDATFWGSMFPAVVGDTVLASCRDGGKYSCVFIETVNGWVLVRYTRETRSVTVSRSNNGVFSETNHIWDDGIVPSYYFDNAIIGGHIIGETSVGIIVNGTVILRVDTDSAILSVGWANGYGQNNLCTISDPIMMRGKKLHGLPLINIICIGDSTGDRNVTIYSQFDYAMKYYAGLGGGQVAKLTNLASSGDTSSQQAQRLLATDISGYTFCLIQVGINNIQQQKGVSSFLADIESMIDYCRRFKVEPIVGIPAMFYTRNDIRTAGISTDHLGQPSAKSELGSLYRLGLIRLCANKNVMLSSSGDSNGVVSPRLLGLEGVDPMMMDNIHQTAFGSMLMGMAWARTMASYFIKNGRETKRKDSLIGPRSASVARLSARYFSAGGGGDVPQTPLYSISDDGKLITLSYYLSRGTADWSGDVIVGKLPARLRPMTDQRFLTQGTNSGIIPVGGLVSVVITRNGDIRLLGATNDCYFVPFNITYSI
ncbi:hypothetical protein BSK71_07635 [Pectobacterium actinidiae]|uniref:SGNH hydrolase-type esterase domain-containing protein n=1 Tax=Pectobacterium actinidiae TaxID=1507808 RepID=A0A1V2R543_9GAMM|nr:hypothetical protein KKH3_15320 [Pectobacterium actinidiae]ONK04922.1 hypothetical protein BSK69_07355 [Pectobacterium actinidiae]ONK07544.1 hypothetical protein BSK71_07635 [Pectobacterium actinidiae]